MTKEGRIKDMAKKSCGKNVLLISFFFDYRANHGIRNNFQGLRRSLLYQLLSCLNHLASEVRTHFGLGKVYSHEWLGDDSTLASILDFVLRKLSVPVLLFLDGLDEYRGEKVELLYLVDDLVSAGVRICLASRDETPFTIKFRELPSLRMDKVNHPGIISFATAFLTRNLDTSIQERKNVIDSLAEGVATRSAGVFLWARFAVFAIIDAKGQGLNENALKAKLETVPLDLEKIYARMFESKSSEDRKRSGIALRLVTSAKRDILLSELFEACLLAGILTRPSEAMVNQGELDGFARYTLTLGGGVLELCPITRGKSDRRIPITSARSGQALTVPSSVVQYVVVKIIHRSVQTYLDEGGWSTLLGDDECSTCRSLTWLKVCIAFCKQDKLRWTTPERLNWDPFVDPCVMCMEDNATAPLGTLAEFGLLKFVGHFLPQFAFDYEVESGKSSWSLTHTVLTPLFTHLHIQHSTELRTGSGCICRHFPYLTTPRLLSGPHLAVVHMLLGFVQDELKHNPVHPLLNSAPETVLDTSEQPEMRSGSSYVGRGLSTSAVAVGRDRLSLLQTAVLCSTMHRGPRRSALVSFLASVSPRLKDQDLLYAIQGASVADIKTLLLQFPPGPLQLRSSIDFQGFGAGKARLAEPQFFGPLWAVALRNAADNDTVEILDVLLQRGENINGICGPYWTALHAALAKHFFSPDMILRGMLNLLIQRGADGNLPGRDGNALEYLWKRANTHPVNFNRVSKYASHIRYLIDNGAINQRADPNGRVPSLESMLTFGTSKCLFDRRQEIYVHGRVVTGNKQEFDEDYRRAYDMYVRPRLPGALVLAAQHGLSATAPDNHVGSASS